MLDAEGWDRRYASKDRVFAREPTEIVAELIAPLPPGRALDLATGEGRHAIWLAQGGWSVTAVDFSRVGLEKAAARAQALGLEIEPVQADLYDYRPPRAAFDLVLLAYMHPEPGRRATVLSRAAEALRPGGRLLVIGRDLADANAGHGPSDPDRRYTVARLVEALPATLAVERCEQVMRKRHDPDGARTMVDTIAWGRRRTSDPPSRG